MYADRTAFEPWGLAEYIHGRDLTAGGTRHQGWSAAAAIIARHALKGAGAVLP